jgi:enoyl-CoA hydratase
MHSLSDPRIQLTSAGGIATITIARPEKLNALDHAMIRALEQAALTIDADTSIKVAIITGAGEKAFCAGGDIDAWSSLSPEQFGMSWVRAGHRAFDALARLRQPLIASLNGVVFGGGFEIAATPDFRVAARHAKFSMPETGLGIIPGWSGTQRMVRRFGSQTMRRLSLAGETFSAEQALSLGLVDEVADNAMSAATALAKRILARSSYATQATKLMINAAEGEDPERAIEALAGYTAAASEELATNLKAFRERKAKK